MTLISYYRSIKIYYFTIPQNSVIWTRLNIAYKQRYKHQWQLRVFLTLNYTYSSIWLTISLPKEVILTPEERFSEIPKSGWSPSKFPIKGLQIGHLISNKAFKFNNIAIQYIFIQQTGPKTHSYHQMSHPSCFLLLSE